MDCVCLLILLILIFIIIYLFLRNQTTAKDVEGTKDEKYYSSEHIATADGNSDINYQGITLYFPSAPTGVASASRPLQLTNGIQLTFGQILSLSGDYYGVPDKPISEGANVDEQQQRFWDAFNTLDGTGDRYATNSDQLQNCLDSITPESDLIHNAIINGQEPSEVLTPSALLGSLKKKVSCTGGVLNPQNITIPGTNITIPLVTSLSDVGGRATALAQNNLDHFVDGPNRRSWVSYNTGHQLAMNIAAGAQSQSQTSDLSDVENILVYAYTIDAFACHFLSDHFATGHLRTPRSVLKNGTRPLWNKTVGNLLSLFMHDEDNKNGLFLVNNACNYSSDQQATPCMSWTAYGDKRFSDPENSDNRNMQQLALQQSVTEVWNSFTSGTVQSSIIWQMLPATDFQTNSAYLTNNETWTLTGTSVAGSCLLQPNSCNSELGPEWSEISQSDCSRICQRQNINSTPMFYYDGDMLWKRNKKCDGSNCPTNSMTTVDSEVITFAEFQPYVQPSSFLSS